MNARIPSGIALVGLVAGLACSTPPSAPSVVGDDGYVTTHVTPEVLSTQGLLPPYPACCPGSECCAPPYFCAYYDTADYSIADAGAGLVSGPGLRLAGTSPTPGVGAACKQANAVAYLAPNAIATVMSYDRSMDYGQPSFSDNSDNWFVDGARRGLGDFATDGTLSNAMFGAAGRQPLWPGADWWCWYWDSCNLSCNQGDYDNAASPVYALASQGGSMIGSIPDPHNGDSFTEMGPENPVHYGWRAARKRLYDYWSTAPNGKITTLAVALAARAEATNCGTSWDMNTLNDDAYYGAWSPPAGMPSVYTHVSGYYMTLNAYYNYFNAIRINGFGGGYYFWPGNVDGTPRVATKNALSFFRTQDKTRAFYIYPPSNGEAIDDASLKFYLSIDGNERLLTNRGSRGGCYAPDATGTYVPVEGYWMTRPEGATGRVLLSLCPQSAVDAANATNTLATAGRVVYDCVEQFPASATFVRDFDLSRCGSSDTPSARALRLDWKTEFANGYWWTAGYVYFRLRFAGRAADLATAPVAMGAYAVPDWPASVATFVDLTDRNYVTLPANYQAARLEVFVVASPSDLRRSPTVRDWKLTFTCVDGN